MNRHYAMVQARGALQQARDGLGADAHVVLAEEEKLLAATEERYRDQLTRAAAFLNSKKVRELEQRRERLQATIADAERLGMKRTAEQAKSELRAVEAQWSSLVREAGL